MFFYSPPFIRVGGAIAEIAFVGADAVSNASNTIAWPAGTQAGDMAIIMVVGNAAPSWSDFSGWTTDVNGGTVQSISSIYAYSKASLSAGEVTSPPSFTGAQAGGYCVAVWRGGSAITKKTELLNDGGDTADLPGFTKAANSSRIVSILCDRNTGADITVPAGFTELHEENITFFDFGVADIASADYTDDATMTWAGLGAGFNQAAVSWELT